MCEDKKNNYRENFEIFRTFFGQANTEFVAHGFFPASATDSNRSDKIPIMEFCDETTAN